MHDLIVVGGGPVGLALTALMTRRGFSVVCLDRAPHQDDIPTPRQPLDRAVALSWGSLQFLDQLGLKEPLCQKGSAIHDIWVTKDFTSPSLHYDAKDHGHPMGINVSMAFLKSLLYGAAKDHVFMDSHVEGLVKENGAWTVHLTSGQAHRGRLLVGADGGRSAVREKLGIPTKTWSYDQTSLVTTLHHGNPHHHQAYEIFSVGGPLALLPYGGPHTSSLIWTMPPVMADAYQNVSPDFFLDAFNQATHGFLGGFTFPDAVKKEPTLAAMETVDFYPLKGLYCPRPISDQSVLIGDAAHVMHPVAGQGFNVGLRDVWDLGQLLLTHRRLGLSWWGEACLQAHVNGRRPDVLSMIAMTHGLVSLFSKDYPLVRKGLSLGLSILDAMPFLKKRLSTHAMGLSLL